MGAYDRMDFDILQRVIILFCLICYLRISTVDNQLLYRSLFEGREDVYAIHWSKGTKSGYMLAKFYDPYISKVYKKSTNPNSSETANYLPLTDDQIQRHLEGRQLTGLKRICVLRLRM